MGTVPLHPVSGQVQPTAQSERARTCTTVQTRQERPAWRRARDLVAEALTRILGRFGARSEWATRLGVSRQRLDRWTEPGDTSCPTLADVLLMPEGDRRELLRVVAEASTAPAGSSAHQLLITAGKAGGLVSAVAAALADAKVDDDERASLVMVLDDVERAVEEARALLRREGAR